MASPFYIARGLLSIYKIPFGVSAFGGKNLENAEGFANDICLLNAQETTLKVRMVNYKFYFFHLKKKSFINSFHSIPIFFHLFFYCFSESWAFHVFSTKNKNHASERPTRVRTRGG